MPSFHIHDPSHGVDLVLAAGWTGVVGATRDDEQAFITRIVREPDSLRVHRCAPRPEVVAAALADRPDVLVVDDLTSRPDPEARAALLASLRAHAGVGLIALRDRALLDELTTATIRVAGGVPRLYAASYLAARAMWQADAEAAGRARAAAADPRTSHLTAEAHQAAQAAAQTRTAAHAVIGARNHTHGRRTQRRK